MLFLASFALWLAFDTWRWGVLGGVGEHPGRDEEHWEQELAELEALSRSAINAKAGGGKAWALGDDWFERYKMKTTPPPPKSAKKGWWLTNKAHHDDGDGTSDTMGNKDPLGEPDEFVGASPPVMTDAERTAALKARLERERERERALLEKLRLARKARLEELRRERYHQSPEYKRWLKNREEKKKRAEEEREASRRAAPFQNAPWRMHDGKFHDLENTPVVRSTKLVVAGGGGAAVSESDGSYIGMERAAVEERAANLRLEMEEGSDVGGTDMGGVISSVKDGQKIQERQHDSYLRRGGAVHAWASAPPAFDALSDDSSSSSYAADEDSPGLFHTHKTLSSKELHDGTALAKRWAALMKPRRSSSSSSSLLRRGGGGVDGVDAQTFEATVVYGDGADVKGGGLDIEGIEEDDSRRGNAHKSHHGGAVKDEVSSKQRVAAVTGGGSSDVRLGGDRYGVGLVDMKNKAVHHGSRGSSAMIRGHSGEDNVVQVGNTYKTNGGRSKYLYQTGAFASLSNGRSV